MPNVLMNPDAKVKTQDRDQAFADSGLHEDFREQFNANWEAYNPESIQDTFWDRFSNFFGARSSADKTRLQLEQARKEQIAQLVGLQREQVYNSEDAKTARMRAAGLNPDLQGLGSASEASEATEPEQRPDFSQLSSGADIASGFSNALTKALTLYSGILGLREQGINIAGKEIQQAIGGSDDAISLIANLYSKEGFKKYFEGDVDEDGNNVYAGIPDKAFKLIGIRSKRARKMLTSYVNTAMNTYAGDIKKYKTLGDWIDSKKHYAESRSAWYNPEGSDESVRQALKVYADILHDLDVKSANFQRTYYSYIKADKLAAAENAAANFRSFSTQKKKELYQKLTKNGDTFSLLLATSLMGDSNAVGMLSSGARSVAKFL